MSRKATICLAIPVLALAGCGGSATLSKKDIQKQAGSVQSFAAEGALVAQGAQEARTTDAFVRVHTDYMAKETTKIGAQVGKAHANGSLDEKRVEIEKLAFLVSQDLNELHVSPGDRSVAARVRSDLELYAADAGKLAK